MTIKSDRWIRKMALEQEMITPFEEGIKRPGKISYGLSSYGYDIRLTNQFKVMRYPGLEDNIVDPKNFNEDLFFNIEGDVCVIPPNSFILASSYEYIQVPKDVLVICLGKSTMARCGLIVNITPLEPEWKGYITIEISNTTPYPAKVYANEGIAQLLFYQSDEPCEVSYANKSGKYQNQQTIVLPKVD